LNKGDSFGELALANNAPRAATIIAAMDTNLVTLSRAEYQKIISSLNQFKIQEIILFFKNLPLFNYLSDQNLEFVASRI
jgi:CRP-like cAMP-binding protein